MSIIREARLSSAGHDRLAIPLPDNDYWTSIDAKNIILAPVSVFHTDFIWNIKNGITSYSEWLFQRYFGFNTLFVNESGCCCCWFSLLGSCHHDYRGYGASSSPGQLLLPTRRVPAPFLRSDWPGDNNYNAASSYWWNWAANATYGTGFVSSVSIMTVPCAFVHWSEISRVGRLTLFVMTTTDRKLIWSESTLYESF